MSHPALIFSSVILMRMKVWRVELAASTGAMHFNSSSSGTNSVTHQMGMASSSPLKHQFAGGGSGAHYANGAIPEGSRRRYNSVGVNKDSNAVLSSASSGGGGFQGRGRSVGNTPPRVCGSSMVRCVSPEEGPLVSVHHFNTELGSPLVYGTRKGGVRSWDLRTREVRGMMVWRRVVYVETDSGYDVAVGGESSHRYCVVKA